MKKIFIYFFLISSNLYSQTNYEYFGALKLNGNDASIITYRITFTEAKGAIKGYSITDIGGKHETKNVIEGFYNKKTKVLTFKELNVLYTKSPLSKDVFCFVNFSGKVKLINDNSKLEGDFKGLYKNNLKCIDGTLLLIGSNKLYKFLNKINTKIQTSKKIDAKTKEKVNPIAVFDSLKVNTLTKNQNLNVFVGSNELELEVWDAKIEDGDRIDLYQNGKKILDNYTVLNKKRKITIKLDADTNIFKIVALNEGERTLNTAMILIIDKERTFELETNLKKGENTSITVIKN